MHLDPQAVFDAAMRLPEGDRLALASQLLESLPPEDTTMALDDSELAAELDRRFSTSDAGIPWAVGITEAIVAPRQTEGLE